MAKQTFSDYVLVGAGVTSVWAAQNIRERDDKAQILIVGSENHPPYDRPPLSKQHLLRDDWQLDDSYSKFDRFYIDNRIDIMKNSRVIGIERGEKCLRTENGEEIRYDKLLIATGSRPRTLDLPGVNLPGVHYLRTVDQAESLRQAIKSAKQVVLIGAGFIGMEVASACAQRGLEATIIEMQDRPYPIFTSTEVGRFLQDYYEARGVQFLLNDSVVSMEGSEYVTGIRTGSGQLIPADLVVIGAGAILNVELAQSAGLQADRNGVYVNAHLQTEDPSIWAAGDIAYFEDLILQKRWHAEHHLNAKWQGRAVGANMAGENKPYEQVAYFYSDVFDLHLCLRGETETAARRVILGDLQAGEFAEINLNDSGQVRGGVICSNDEPKMDAIGDRLAIAVRERVSLENLQETVREHLS
jgi:3-phenylpropionate/trans-cinnamate dioxygenase ferredoxin reductase subunit